MVEHWTWNPVVREFKSHPPDQFNRMKVCTKCHQPKPLSDFHKSRKCKFGCQPWCKSCVKTASHNSYKKRPLEKIQASRDSSKKRGEAIIIEYLATHPCMKCGEIDPIVLEFHHRNPSTKRMDVCLMRQHSRSSIMKEIEKCDVLCANCHRRETASQLSFWKHKFRQSGQAAQVVSLIS